MPSQIVHSLCMAFTFAIELMGIPHKDDIWAYGLPKLADVISP